MRLWLCSLLLSSVAVAAPERTGAPYFVLPTGDGVDALPLKESRVDFSVAGVVARVRLQQVYANVGKRTLEATYVFPASTRAAVSAMRMRIGERVIEARILKKEAARQTYDSAKKEGQHATLLEQQRPNVFQMQVANLRPGDVIEVQLDYTELLLPTEGVYELVVPTVVGPRYVGQKTEAWSANPTSSENEAPTYAWSLKGRIAAGMPVLALASPSHPLRTTAQGAATSIETDDLAGGNRDFILRYKLRGEAIQTGVVMYPGADESFFMLMMQPPARVIPAELPPREYVFVVDVSGSMNGFPLSISKQLMRDLLKGLRAQDRFNVYLFAGGSASLAADSVPATSENVSNAIQVIDGMVGGGGTELLPVLRKVLQAPRAPGMSTNIVVLTDGYVSVEPEAMKLVREQLGVANLFAFGIGSSVNRHLIEGLARAGYGEPFVVTEPRAAESEAGRFRALIESPVLSDISVDAEGFDVYDVTPHAVPDLFAERPLVLLGKYRGAPGGSLVVRGHTAAGVFERRVEVHSDGASDDWVALRDLWARQQIEHSLDRQSFGEQGLEPQITQLALRYGLLSPFTSFVAVDSRIVNRDGKQLEVKQTLPLPAGVPATAVGGEHGISMNSVGGVGGLGLRGTGAGGGGAASSGILGSFGSEAVGLGGGGTGYGVGRGKEEHQIRVQSGVPLMMGSISKDEIHRIIKRSLGRFRYCYEKELLRNPTLAGKVQMQWVVDPDGKTKDVKLTSSMNNAALDQCLTRALTVLRFPKPAGGGVVKVSYPLVFRTQ